MIFRRRPRSPFQETGPNPLPRALKACLAVAALFGTGATPPSSPTIASIAIDAHEDAEWTATYRLPQPAASLVFQRSPDTSRTVTWKAPAGYVIVAGPDGEEVRRQDGRPFRSVSLRMRPVYMDLPKDYAPFAPFGDGAILFHSGRFFACATVCPDNPRWQMSIQANANKSIIVKGRIRLRSARWEDADDGSYIYIGKGRPAIRSGMVAIIDKALPPQINAQLDRDLPRFGSFYAARLGDLSAPPSLFASFDAAHIGGWGRQGGTLPGQIFTHFYGQRWSTEMTKPSFSFDLSWHFAHEIGHLYQRGIAGADKGASWMHEGAAEAFAAILLRDLDAAEAWRIDQKIGDARKACASATERRSLANALESGNYQVAYSCGLILNLKIDDAVRRLRPEEQGLFTVWRRLIASRPVGSNIAEVDYAAAVGRLTSSCVSKALIDATISPTGPLGREIDNCSRERPDLGPQVR